MSDAREQFAACEALLNDGAVDACAAAAETLTKQYPRHARAWCLRAALAPQASEALKHAERAKALKPHLDCTRTALARQARGQGLGRRHASLRAVRRRRARQILGGLL
jgi:7-keto-8-aminopelargonate synthetase-like enzyme